jgi:hypothetical protein
MLRSQNNAFILRKSQCNSSNFLHTILKCGECIKNMGHLFPKETVSDTTLPELTGRRENVVQSTFFARLERQYSERDCQYFQDTRSTVAEQCFQKLRGLLESCSCTVRNCSMKWGKLNCRGNTDYKFPVDIGFICDKACAYGLMKCRR